jgi:hypothetical protein
LVHALQKNDFISIGTNFVYLGVLRKLLFSLLQNFRDNGYGTGNGFSIPPMATAR